MYTCLCVSLRCLVYVGYEVQEKQWKTAPSRDRSLPKFTSVHHFIPTSQGECISTAACFPEMDGDDQGTVTEYPSPTRTERVPFKAPGTDKPCETSSFVYGDLASDRPPLIVVHGGPGASSRNMVPLATLYQKYGIPLILYDQIGCGDSTHLRDTKGDTDFWTMDLFVAELSNLVAHFQLGYYDLLGHSWGGMVTAYFALTQPRGLRKLILFSSPASFPARVAASCRQRSEMPEQYRQTLEAGVTDSPEYNAAMTEFMRRHMFRPDHWPPAMTEGWNALEDDDTVGATMFGGTLFSHPGPLANLDVTSRLPEITESTVPGGILLLNGRYDMVSDECMEAYATETKANVVDWVHFENSSHFPYIEEPAACFKTLGDFLTSS